MTCAFSEDHQQGLDLALGLIWTEILSKTGLLGSQGAYLHTIVLLVSSTLPSCGGEKVQG